MEDSKRMKEEKEQRYQQGGELRSMGSSQSDLLNLLMIKDSEQNSLEHRVRDSQDKIIKKIEDSVAVNDEYGNSLLAIGTNDKVESFTNYGFSNDTLNYPLWLALYNDSWVFRRAIDKPAQDEVRCGVTLYGDSDKASVYTYLNNSRSDMIQLLQWGALFGGSIAVMMFDGMKDNEYSYPMNYEKIKKSKVIRYYVTDRWYGVSPSDRLVTNMKSLDYGKPAYYDITFADGKSLRVHHDYILRYEHRTAPKLIKNGALQGWGYAEGSHILNELSRDDKLKASIQSLVDKSLIEVIKMSGMRGVFMGTDSGSEQQLKKRLEMVNWGRTYNSLTFLDKDDDYQMNHYQGLNGLSDILEKNMWLISAALEMQGVLFGDLKSGFANDTEALERYDETINGRCESYVRPIYEKLLRVLYKMCGIEEKVEFTFNSLLMKQQNENRMENISKFVELCTRLLDAGVLTSKDFGEALNRYITKDEINFDLTKEKLDKLDDDFKTQMENFDLGNNLDNNLDNINNEKEENNIG